jgi:hypothetical protein
VPVPELVEAWSTSLVRALTTAEVPMTVSTLSGPAPSGPTGVAASDTEALANQIVGRARTPLVGFEPGGHLGNLLLSASSVVHDGELRSPLPADHRWAWISTEDQAALAVAAMQRPDLARRWSRMGEHHVGPGPGPGSRRRARPRVHHLTRGGAGPPGPPALRTRSRCGPGRRCCARGRPRAR